MDLSAISKANSLNLIKLLKQIIRERGLPRAPQDQGMKNSDDSPLSNSVKPLAKKYRSFNSLTLIGFLEITSRSFLEDRTLSLEILPVLRQYEKIHNVLVRKLNTNTHSENY